MCGIVGIANYKGPAEQLRNAGLSMLSTIVHRGPDGEGLWLNDAKDMLLGHRRLAIQDLSSAGTQPMHSPSSRYCVTYNGEIYNFRALRNELEKLGFYFKGGSDTEVLLTAIEAWGVQGALKRFTGMFAFGLWDRDESTLYLCRDRLGEKPLYYGYVDGTFYFASELKAIEKYVTKAKLSISMPALNCFMRYGYINAPYSIYQNIFKLMPGTLLSLSADDLTQQSLTEPLAYWSLPDIATSGMANILQTDDAVDAFDKLLRRTVQQQLVADVSVGTFLSGGIDSSLVSAIAQDVSDHKINTFSVGFHEQEYDESQYAERIARHIDSQHTTVYVSSSDARAVIPELHHVYDEPFADSSQIPSILVSRIARQHVTVCLSGDGGDELFAGYNRYNWLAKIWKITGHFPKPVQKLLASVLSALNPHHWDRLYRLIASCAGQRDYRLLGLKIQKLAGLLRSNSIYEAYDFLNSYWPPGDKVLLPPLQYPYTSQPGQFPAQADFIHKAMFWDQLAYLPGDNLVKVDRASMSASLETRLPLLSHEVVEFSWQLPLAMKLNGGQSKYILRRILDRYVPRELLDRPKMGFSVPVSSWLRNELKEWAGDLISSNRTRGSNLFSVERIDQVWHQHQKGRLDHSHRLWALLMYLAWENH